MSKNIAIDGPAGAGKSTIAKQLAKDLGYIYVDTGAMYRAMGLYFTSKQIDPQDGDKISEAAKDAVVSLSYVDGMQHVLLNGKDVTGEIRTEEAGKMASATSGYPAVREHLTNLQKELAARENVVMDGRDIGTCVLPNADLKVYLTASSEVRGKRRYKELVEKGVEADLDVIIEDIEKRDAADMNREVSPLRQAEDALLLDSSELTIDQVVETMKDMCKRKGLLS
ncbi:cytidylate kinase [Lachnospiraceae bacterium C10]|jgi:cytidylate kinase|nr:cytidylate kinase [Lachnospiraceae bacterium C10]SDW04144.1 cytidylate kinase [Lachnospiraceae bacterium KHCPX20]